MSDVLFDIEVVSFCSQLLGEKDTSYEAHDRL